MAADKLQKDSAPCHLCIAAFGWEKFCSHCGKPVNVKKAEEVHLDD